MTRCPALNLMTAQQLGAELLRPVTDQAMLWGLVVFLLLFTLIEMTGLFGIWLLVVTAPAFSRFLLRIAQSRIEGRGVEPPSIESFNPVDSIWTYLPLVLFVLAAAGVIAAAQGIGWPVALLLTGIFLFALPASVAVLALTHSPAEALDPRSLLQLMRTCGRTFLILPVSGAILLGLLFVAASADWPGWIAQILEVLGFMLMFSLTGAVVAAAGDVDWLAAPEGVELEADIVERRQDIERQAVLSHAYGLFSRGNAAGGLAHIEGFVRDFATYTARIDELGWFFDSMLAWEEGTPALLLAQRYLSELQQNGDSQRALKVLTRCYLEAEVFRPLDADRPVLLEMSRHAGRDDLVTRLERGR